MMRRTHAWIMFAAASAILVLLFAVPLCWTLVGGVRPNGQFTLKYIAAVFENPVYVEGLINSLIIACGTTFTVCVIALPLAWLSNRYDFAGKRLISALLLVPMILPPFVGAIGLGQILGTYGSLNSLLGLGPIDWLGKARLLGVILLQALGMYPILYLNVTAALANVDPAMEEAAENLGCGAFKRFWKITLPLILPGMFAGCTIVFIWSFTELGTPLMLNYMRCTPVQIFDALKDIGTSPMPYALVIVMLTVSVGLYAISKLTLGRGGHAMTAKGQTASGTRRLTGGKGLLVTLPFVALICVAIVPHLGVVITSFTQPGEWYRTVLPAQFTLDHYRAALGHEMTLGSIHNSLVYSSCAVVAILVLGLVIAQVVVRSNLPVRGALDALSMLPLAVPGLVMAFGYVAVSFNLASQDWVKNSPAWQSIVDVRVNPTMFLVIAYAIRRLPYMVRSAVAGLQQTSVTLEEAAANLGASPVRRLVKITLPLIMANLIAGAVLVFAFSMLEVSDSLILAQRQQYYPITRAIYDLFQIPGTGKYLASALGVWAMCFLATAILGASLVLGKKMGALFRV